MSRAKKNLVRILYLRLQVFHMQSLGYSAQGHSRCAVSEFQTEENLKNNEILVKEKTSTAGESKQAIKTNKL